MSRITNFDNANLRLLITDQDGILEAASLQQSDGAIQVASITLNNDQIKALPTTPVELVAAPGSGKIIAFLSGFIVLDARGGVYGGVAGISYGSDHKSAPPAILIVKIGGDSVSAYVDVGWGLEDDSQPVWFTIPPYSDPLTNLTDWPNWIADPDAAPAINLDGTSDYLSSVENQPLNLTCFNGSPSTNFTAGNASNTMKVTVYYSKANL